MPWTRITASDFVDFADKLNDYLTLAKEAGTPTR